MSPMTPREKNFEERITELETALDAALSTLESLVDIVELLIEKVVKNNGN